MERQTRRLPNHQAGIARKLTDKNLGQTVPVPTTSQGSSCADLCADRTRRRPGARVIGRAFRSMGSAETLNAPRLCPKLGLRTARESITNITVWLPRENCWPGPGMDRIRPIFLAQFQVGMRPPHHDPAQGPCRSCPARASVSGSVSRCGEGPPHGRSQSLWLSLPGVAFSAIENRGDLGAQWRLPPPGQTAVAPPHMV
jgi:hypothetical protein